MIYSVVVADINIGGCICKSRGFLFCTDNLDMCCFCGFDYDGYVALNVVVYVMLLFMLMCELLLFSMLFYYLSGICA